MIKFFRKIRQRLLSENKFSKYLIYAIGEIVLVVIGILIALSINNGNEERKSREEEKIILAKLTADLKWNHKEIEGIKNITSLRLKSAETILNYLETNKPLDDRLKLSFEYVNRGDLFNNANTSYKYIENRGMNVLRNDSLQSRITLMYERHFKNIEYREQKDMNMLTDDLRPIMDQVFETSEAQLTPFNEKLALNKPLNMVTLRQNEQFKNVIVRLHNYFLVRITKQEETINELEELIIDLENVN